MIRAVVLTHGHEDHVGALPYLLREIERPRGLGDPADARAGQVQARRARPLRAAELREIDPRATADRDRPVQARVRPRWRTRSPTPSRSCSTPRRAVIVHTGDYKLDHTPVDGMRTDVGRLAELGNRGVDLLLGDSTNAERPGFTQSERVVGEAFRQIIPRCTGRVLIASFASNVHRMQQAIDVARRDRPQGVRRRPLDAQERQHRAQPRLHRRARGHPRAAERPRRASRPTRR